jgi:hypothetical protein
MLLTRGVVNLDYLSCTNLKAFKASWKVLLGDEALIMTKRNGAVHVRDMPLSCHTSCNQKRQKSA